jgi:hypothetical protein
MTADIKKMKALALAATKGPWMRLFGERTVYDRMEDGCRGNAIVRADVAFSMQDANNLDFIAAANPASVLELIAEVEHLRAELAPGAAGGGAPVHQAFLGTEGWVDIGEHEISGYKSSYFDVRTLYTAPAVGTVEKDAERLDWLDEINRQTNEHYGTTYGWKFDINHNRAALMDHNWPALSIREAIDAAIAAHTKAAKEPT